MIEKTKDLESYKSHSHESEDPWFGKVYSRMKGIVSQPMQLHDSDPTPKNKVNSSPSIVFRGEPHNDSSIQNDSTSLPIAIRKGIRKCTEYPISHYISFNKCSTAHRSFLTTLNHISIPHTLSEALSNENWKQAMNVEMQALERRIRHGSL